MADSHSTSSMEIHMLTSRNITPSLDHVLAAGRALDEAFLSQRRTRAWVPAMDVVERNDAYVVYAELCGVSPDRVEIQFEQNVLTVRGTKPSSFDPSQDGELRIFSAERAHGTFERAIRLPEFVDAEKIDASFADGLLSVVVPKAKGAQARKITIRAADSR